jgi:hypothetical protein
MSADPTVLGALRQRLAERFPEEKRLGARRASGLVAIDDAVGGLPIGAITELISVTPSSGVQTLLGTLARALSEGQGRVGWIDAHDSFDPSSWDATALAPLVWARAASTAAAVQVADLFARDANFPVVILDLRLAPENELRRVPLSAWYRLQRAAESAARILIIVTPRACVASAQLRLQLTRAWTLHDLESPRTALVQTQIVAVQRERGQRLSRAG